VAHKIGVTKSATGLCETPEREDPDHPGPGFSTVFHLITGDGLGSTRTLVEDNN
jgi:hypothetical protein